MVVSDAKIECIIERVAFKDWHIHVSFDIDVLDPGIEPGRATFREAYLTMKMLRDSNLFGRRILDRPTPVIEATLSQQLRS